MTTFFHLRLIPLLCNTTVPASSWPSRETGYFSIERSSSPDAPSSSALSPGSIRITFSDGSFTLCERATRSHTRFNGRALLSDSPHLLAQNDVLELARDHNSDYKCRFSFRVDLLSSSSATPQLPGPYSLTPSRRGPQYALMDDMKRSLDDMSERHPVSGSGSSSSPQSAAVAFSPCTVTTKHIIPRFPSDPNPTTSGPILASAVSFRYGDFVGAPIASTNPSDHHDALPLKTAPEIGTRTRASAPIRLTSPLSHSPSAADAPDPSHGDVGISTSAVPIAPSAFTLLITVAPSTSSASTCECVPSPSGPSSTSVLTSGLTSGMASGLSSELDSSCPGSPVSSSNTASPVGRISQIIAIQPGPPGLIAASTSASLDSSSSACLAVDRSYPVQFTAQPHQYFLVIKSYPGLRGRMSRGAGAASCTLFFLR
ncbi:hypothetical protein CF336_g6578 [Tilletia laevis]|nr:hypothetical protein CF336_g6578 [Tilletia laevis]KAE8188482.1 hypothetical protein CF328_g6586 [Tilletia controversa]